MPKELKKLIKKKKQKIQITEKDGKIKVVGEYDPDKKIFYCKRNRTEHFFQKYNAWGLDAKVVEFLAKNQASVILKDTETKWEYKCDAIDFRLKGVLEEYKQYRPQYFPPVIEWEVLKAKDRSVVIQCEETDCKYNFGLQCLKGAIKIGKEGDCISYTEKFE